MGTIGATRLPMGLYGLPLLPNDDPSLAQHQQAIIAGQPKIVIFQPTHAGLKRGKRHTSVERCDASARGTLYFGLKCQCEGEAHGAGWGSECP